MKLEYKILWFEDVESSFNTMKGYVEEFLEENGFITIINRYEDDGSDLDSILSREDYDLILMDYNLNGIQGDEIIENIRSQELYTEIIFYSSSGAQQLRNAIGSKGIDGVFCTSRQISEFEDKVKNVIKNTIKKVQDVNNMRGLVIAEAIDLENQIKEVLQGYFNIQGSESPLSGKKQRVYSGICLKKQKNNKNEADFLKTVQDLKFDDLLERKHFLTSMNLFHALQSVIKEEISELESSFSQSFQDQLRAQIQLKPDELRALKTTLNDFGTEIIEMRNILAHVQEKKDENGIPYLESMGKNDIQVKFTNEKYIELRRLIQKHATNLSEIVTYFINPLKEAREVAPAGEQ